MSYRSSAVSVDKNVVLNLLDWKGAGTPCVCVHGFSDAACVWRSLAVRIAPRLRTIAIDLRGHGNSDWDAEGRYDSQTFAGDLSKVVAALDLGRVVLVGHSLGAETALRFVCANPDAVSALVIVDFGPETNRAAVDQLRTAHEEMPRYFQTLEEYTTWLSDRRPLSDTALLRELASYGSRVLPSGQFETKADPCLAAGWRDERVVIDGRYCDRNLWAALEKVKCPCLVVRGLGSSVLPADVARRMAETALPAGKLSVVSGAGHGVMLDNSAAFVETVDEFLNDTVVGF